MRKLNAITGVLLALAGTVFSHAQASEVKFGIGYINDRYANYGQGSFCGLNLNMAMEGDKHDFSSLLQGANYRHSFDLGMNFTKRPDENINFVTDLGTFRETVNHGRYTELYEYSNFKSKNQIRSKSSKVGIYFDYRFDIEYKGFVVSPTVGINFDNFTSDLTTKYQNSYTSQLLRTSRDFVGIEPPTHPKVDTVEEPVEKKYPTFKDTGFNPSIGLRLAYEFKYATLYAQYKYLFGNDEKQVSKAKHQFYAGVAF